MTNAVDRQINAYIYIGTEKPKIGVPANNNDDNLIITLAPYIKLFLGTVYDIHCLRHMILILTTVAYASV